MHILTDVLTGTYAEMSIAALILAKKQNDLTIIQGGMS